jgi:hypothetical protein
VPTSFLLSAVPTSFLLSAVPTSFLLSAVPTSFLLSAVPTSFLFEKADALTVVTDKVLNMNAAAMINLFHDRYLEMFFMNSGN